MRYVVDEDMNIVPAQSDPAPERLALLPRKDEEQGWVAPHIVNDIIHALRAPGRAVEGDLSPEEAANFALTFTGGGIGSNAVAPIDVGSLGMGAAGRRKLAEAGVPEKRIAIADEIRDSDYLLPHEYATVSGRTPNIEKFNAITDVLPSAAEMAAVAKAGNPKRGWYEASGNAIRDVFDEDAAQFTGLLAALSPQTSVQSNLINALRSWKGWNEAGRPTGRDDILRVLGENVEGDKGIDSVLDAWKNNSLTSLSGDPLEQGLSGFKVDSFMRNLLGDPDRVTNDAWIANYLGPAKRYQDLGLITEKQVPQSMWASPVGYGAMNARTRKAGDRIDFDPREVQETVWSYVKPAYELAYGGAGLADYALALGAKHPEKASNLPRTAQGVIEGGFLTPEVINATPDFGTLFNSPKYAKVLRDAGYGDRLDSLKPHEWPEQLSLSTAEEKHLQNVARRLDRLAQERGKK